MAARLYPGVKSLQLVLDTPTEVRDGTTDIRDDLISVKVWYSSSSTFNPDNNQGTLVYNGSGLSIPITGLTPNATYYVRYAFISAIDPTVYTISAPLTQTVYGDSTTVYGYLTNDPTPITTATDGTGGDFASATGIFKVYTGTQDVTGVGVTYAIKANSAYQITGATINATTGAYSCTGLTATSGNVTFTATYGGVVLEEVWNVYKAQAGQTAPLIQLSATSNQFPYKDQYATTSDSSQIVVTARLANLTGTPTFTATGYTRAGLPLSTNPNVPFTQNNNVITITSADADLKGVALGSIRVIATLAGISDTFTIYRTNDGSEQITVESSNEAHLIPANTNGTTVAANYIGSGTILKVREGSKYLTVDNVSPFSNGTWRVVAIDSVGITCDTSPSIGTNYIEYDTHSAMTADVATINYTIRVISTTGVTTDIITTQSFAKSKQGTEGATARAVDIRADYQAFITPINTNTPVPTVINLTAVQSNFVNPTYTWLINDAAFTSDVATATGNTLVLKSFPASGVKTVKVTAAEGIYSVYDTFSVYSLKEGSDSISIGLANENQTISCDSTGTPIAGQFPITTTLYVALGSKILSSTTSPVVTFAKVSYTGGDASTYSIDANGNISITSINQQFAEATFSATVNGVTLTKTLSLNKSIDGASAPVVVLTSTGQVFAAAKNTGVISPTSVTLNTAVFNLGTSPTYVWKVSTDSGSTFTTQSVPNTATSFTLPSFTTGTKTVRVEVTGAGKTVYDQITIYALKEGDDSLSGGLINENQTISCDSAGAVIGGQFPLSSQLVVVRGTTILTNADGVTWSKVSETNMTSTIVSTTGVISVTAISPTTSITSASATYRATIGTTTIDKVFTLNKSTNGKAGDNATAYWLTVSAAAIKKNTANVFDPTSITATAYSSVGTAVPAVYSGRFKIYESGSATASYTSAVDESTKTYTPSANATSVKIELYLAGGVTSKIDEQLVPIVVDGSSAVTAFLSNDSVTLNADSAGTVTSFVGAATTMYVFIGSVDDSANWRYSTTKSNVTCTEASDSRIQTISSITGSTGYVDITASRTGYTSITKRFSISKVSNGALGPTGGTGPTGTPGTSGTRTAILDMYKWAKDKPTSLFPSGTSTYTWSNGQFTAPATTNDWYLIPPTAVAGQTLWVARTVYADTGSSLTSTVTWTATSAFATGSAGGDGVNGTRTAYLEVYIWSQNTPTTFPSGNSTYTWSNGQFTAPTTANGWSLLPGASSPGFKLWGCSVSYADTLTTTTSVVPWTTSTAYVVGAAGETGPTGAPGATGTPGTTPNKYATVELYQWSTAATIGVPSGTSTFTWATAINSAYNGGNSWNTSVPTNPGTSGIKLWVATKQVTDIATATTTTVDWSTGYSTYVAGQNGQTVIGTQAARPEVYQWALSTPTISGSSDYTWSNGAYNAPAGWSKAATTSPTTGFSLYRAIASITDSATATTTTINWGTASIVISGYAGANGATGSPGAPGATGATGPSGTPGTPGGKGDPGNPGASAITMYARIANNPVAVSANVTVTGKNYPSVAQGTNAWGSAFGVTWYATDPAPTSNNSLYVSDGIYDGTTNTVWTTPYIASLKVGALSAITTNTGNLTVSDYIKANTAAISGTTMAAGTSGGILFNTGLFAFGNTSTNITFNGSQMTLNGNVVATGNLNANSVTNTTAAYTAGIVSATDSVNWTTAQSVTITTTGGTVFISSGGAETQGTWGDESGFNGSFPQVRIAVGTSTLIEGRSATLAYSTTPAAGTYTIKLEFRDDLTGFYGSMQYNSRLSNRSLFVMELKR